MPNFAWRRIAWTSMLAAISSSLYAVDGVVLIDQKLARAGNVSPGDTPGFPVTISQPGSYRLSENLIVADAATTAIHITADNVTLDLNGFSIIGPTICTPNPTTCNFSGGGSRHTRQRLSAWNRRAAGCHRSKWNRARYGVSWSTVDG